MPTKQKKKKKKKKRDVEGNSEHKKNSLCKLLCVVGDFNVGRNTKERRGIKTGGIR